MKRALAGGPSRLIETELRKSYEAEICAAFTRGTEVQGCSLSSHLTSIANISAIRNASYRPSTKKAQVVQGDVVEIHGVTLALAAGRHPAM